MNNFIYIIRNNINTKVYIGQTTQSVQIRFQQHLKCLKTNRNQHISRAIKKYGKEIFYVETLEECSLSELNTKEEYYIKKYDSFHNGYNLCAGGNQPRKPELIVDITKIINYYNDGKSARYIASKLKISHGKVLKTLHANNVIIRSKNSKLLKYSKISESKLKELLAKNVGITGIAKRLSVQHSSVRTAMKRFNL